MLCVRLLSSTKLSGQTVCINSSFSTSRPPRRISTSSVSKTFGSSGTGLPSRSSRRSAGSRRKESNSNNSLSGLVIPLRGISEGILLRFSRTCVSPLSIFHRELSSFSLGAAKPTSQRRTHKPRIEGSDETEKENRDHRRGPFDGHSPGYEPDPGLVQWLFVAGSMDYAGRGCRAGRRQHAHHLPLGGSRSAPCHLD